MFDIQRMTWTAFAILIGLAPACNGGESDGADVDLSGRWIADGYDCGGSSYIEVIDIDHADDGSLEATKVVGDPCVESGQRTFRGDFNRPVSVGDELTIEFQDGNSNWSEEPLEVRSDDTFQIKEHTYHRSSGENLSGADITGNWRADGYKCDGDAPRQLVEVRQSGDEVEAVKIEGDDCVGAEETSWEGTRDGNPFSIDLYVSAGGDKGTKSGEVEVIARDFLLVKDPDSDDIRYWPQGLFDNN